MKLDPSPKLVTAEKMRAMDRATIEAGTPGIELMERAGRGLLASFLRRVDRARTESVWILCGKGNNGGDGFVLARLLQERGYSPKVFLLADPSEIGGDAAIALKLLGETGLPLSRMGDVELGALTRLGPEDVVVDALFGTGLLGPLRGEAETWVNALRESRARVFAVDIPSGFSGDASRVDGAVVKAEWTGTMAALKQALVFSPAREHAGEVDVIDIGISEDVMAEVGCAASLFGPAEARRALPEDEGRSHKGRWGRCLVAGGSPGMAGAPILAAEAALRMGAGLVRVATAGALVPIVHGRIAEAMTIALPQGEDGQVLAAGAERILGGFGGWDALALGPGLGRYPDTDRFVLKVLGGWNGPIVVDADALNTLAGWGPDSWVPRARELRAGGETGGAVLTPHAGELSRLTGQPIDALLADPIATARTWAERWRVTLLFKGAPSVVAGPGGEVWVNSTGNAGLATGGSGDVLSGIICALLAQGLDGPRSAILGSYLHGLAADLWTAHEDRAQRSLLPRDVIDTLPAALACTQRGAEPPRWRWRAI